MFLRDKKGLIFPFFTFFYFFLDKLMKMGYKVKTLKSDKNKAGFKEKIAENL